jgi:MFS family permease
MAHATQPEKPAQADTIQAGKTRAGKTQANAPGAAYGWYALGVLMLVYLLNFIDRQMVTILAVDIKHDLHIGDAQFGFLYGTAFGVFYAVFGIPLGKLADRWPRTRLLTLGLTTWSAMTAASGLAGNFTQLGLARIGVGVGEATAGPCGYSLLSDYFPARRRATAIAIFSAGIYLGGGVALSIGTGLAHAWDHAFAARVAPFGLAGWQAAFLGLGLPGLVMDGAGSKVRPRPATSRPAPPGPGSCAMSAPSCRRSRCLPRRSAVRARCAPIWSCWRWPCWRRRE